jgi:FPC/CPF motif-containing protein YcgG
MQFASAISAPHAQEKNAIASKLEEFVASADFPCIGAKAALRRRQLEILVVADIRTDSSDRLITRRLQDFAIRHDTGDKMFVSQAVVFRKDADLSEAMFEAYLWERLASLHAIDNEEFSWDPNVASDPRSPHFAFSIGGKGFFVVGLHPNASRTARRFEHPTLIFNLHAQFEQLRQEGRYETLRNKTIERDIALDGSPNPMLARHGQGPAAAQFSGRHVNADWRCPFKDD